MNYPPPIETALADLPNDPKKRHDILVDIFGKYLLWAMNEALSRSDELVEMAEAREKLGRLFRQPYETAANLLSTEQRKAAAAVNRQTLSNFIQLLLGLFTAEGISHRLGQHHAIKFRLVMEICEIESMDVILEEVINRGGAKAFASYWGRWLLQATNK